MGDQPSARRWFGPLLRGLPTTVRYRLFVPAYEDLRHEHLLRVAAARYPGVRQALRAWFALRVLALIVACYRDSPDFVLVHPVRAVAAGCHALLLANRTMLIHDIRHAVRLLCRQPFFATAAVAILALSIGASTAIFSVVNAVLLRPLPFIEAQRLVSLEETADGRRSAVSPVNFFDWEAQAKSFEAMAIYQDQPMTLARGERAEAVSGFVVSSTFFPTLGVQPALGRWFGPDDDRWPGPSNVVLSHGLWQRAFGGARDVIGRRAMFDGQAFTIIGVAREGEEFPEKTDAWFSLSLSADHRDAKARGAHYVNAIARLRSGTTLDQARAEMTAVAARLAAAYPRTNAGSGVLVQDLVAATVGTARTALLLVLGAVGCLLLIACVNIAGLLTARASTRRVEMALRAALGAGRLALVRQALVESLVLAVLSAAIGTLLAAWGTRALLAIAPAGLPRASQSSLDVRVLAFTALVTIASALLFGSFPAWQSLTSRLAGSLKAARSDAGIGGSRRLRSSLVTVEVALALVLLVGASLAIRSFDLLTRVSPGFDPRHAFTFSVSVPEAVYKEPRQVATFYHDLIDRLNHLPGVTSSAAVMIPPVSSSGFSGTFSIEGRQDVSGPGEPRAQMRPITAAYFRTLGVRLLRGRAFDERDGAEAPPVAIVSESAARRYWPGENPIGRRLRMHVSAVRGRQPFREIVGVVGDVKNGALDQPAAPMVYVPHAQHAAAWMAVVVRTSGDGSRLQGAAIDVLRRLDPGLVALEMETLETHVAASGADQRFRAVLLALFGCASFLLAIVGLYGVVAYATAQRRHEIGVRMAVGADSTDVIAMVVAEGMRPVLAGLALGCLGALGLSRVMRNMLFGVRPFEPAIVAGVVATFALAAVVACYVPARRAAAVDPTGALREE